MFTRIYKNDTVYIPLTEAEKQLGISLADKVSVADIYGVACVSESEYNTLIRSDSELWQKNRCHEELTKVSTLQAEASLSVSMMPIKQFIMGGIDPSQEYQSDIERAKKKLAANRDDTVYYKESLDYLRENIHEDKFRDAGLTLQYLTVINEKRIPSLYVFAAGEGIFYSIFCDSTSDEIWDNVEASPDGIVIERLNNDYCVEACTLKRCSDRDFRNYGVLDNIAWCIQNLPLNNEWQNELCVDESGVYFGFEIDVLAKLFNLKAFPAVELFQGIVNFSQN